MKKLTLSLLAFILVSVLAACNGSDVSSDNFDPKVEQEKATEVINGVLTSFEDQEKLAEGKTSDQANLTAWEKLIGKNKDAISKDLEKDAQQRLLYLVTFNKAEDLSNGQTKSNILFTKNTIIKDKYLNETEQTFTFDIERSGFDHKLITLEKKEGLWKIVNVQDPE